jgi:hypothetical protein
VRIAHNRAGLGTLGPLSDIIKEFGFVLPKQSGFFQSMVEFYNSARITGGGAVDDGVLQDMLCFSRGKLLYAAAYRRSSVTI